MYIQDDNVKVYVIITPTLTRTVAIIYCTDSRFFLLFLFVRIILSQIYIYTHNTTVVNVLQYVLSCG